MLAKTNRTSTVPTRPCSTLSQSNALVSDGAPARVLQGHMRAPPAAALLHALDVRAALDRRRRPGVAAVVWRQIGEADGFAEHADALVDRPGAHPARQCAVLAAAEQQGGIGRGRV